MSATGEKGPGADTIIDPAAIEMLRELGGDDEPDLLAELVGVFLTDAPERLRDMHTALAEGDFELLERAAHTLKSSAANLGAVLLCQHAKSLEAAARAREEGELAELTSDCERAFEQAGRVLQQWVA